MSESTDEVSGEEEFSLAALADLDVSEISEVRFENLPAGSYVFEVVESGLNETEKDGETMFYAGFDLKVVECKTCLDPDVGRDSLAGKQHHHRQNIDPHPSKSDVAMAAVGRIRAFISDIGMESSGTLGDIVVNAKGHTFPANIKHTPAKNDPDTVYANLRFGKK